MSTFFWPHTASQSGNSWTMGLLISAVALIGFRVPTVRYLNAALGIWLIVSSVVLPSIWATTRWNDVLVGLVVAALAVITGRHQGRSRAAAG